MHRIGFTGTRGTKEQKELPSKQRLKLHHILETVAAHELHHGDCVVADATAHKMAYEMGYDIIIHPPTSPIYRAFCGEGETGVSILKPRPYLARNKDIVDSSDILVACSRTMQEEQRSGTWHTIRYASAGEIKVPTIIIYPNGSVERRNFASRGSTSR
jgi:Predicted Rossmann fold nucleotide-binding protein involved in DNA uptake